MAATLRHLSASAGCRRRNVAALERSDNVADRCHPFAMLKRGYARDRAPKVERVVRPSTGRFDKLKVPSLSRDSGP